MKVSLKSKRIQSLNTFSGGLSSLSKSMHTAPPNGGSGKVNSGKKWRPKHARATKLGSDAGVTVAQYAGPSMGGSYLLQSCI